MTPTFSSRFPPCPACTSTTAKIVRFPGETVVWWICSECGHTWCGPLELAPPEASMPERRTMPDRRNSGRADRRSPTRQGRRVLDVLAANHR